MAQQQVRRPDGTVTNSTNVLAPWSERRRHGEKDRRRYELQWMRNQHFSAGRQHLRYSPHDHRVIERTRDERDRPLVTADTLGQHNATAIGKLAGDDFRPQLLLSTDSAVDEEYAKQVNQAYGWGWDEEWKGDRKLLQVLRELVMGSGTAALWCYVERNGATLSDSYPHLNGKPLLNEDQRQQTMAASASGQGPRVSMRPLKEATICWRFLSGWNLLPPPGVVDPEDFPYDLLVRPVYLPDLVAEYGDRARQVQPSDVRPMDYISSDTERADTSTGPATAGRLTNHANVYTGFLRPNADYPNGQTIVFSHDNVLLSYEERLPFTDQPYGPRSGVTYFRWEVVPGRFISKAFVERGIDPQKTKNKRVNQIDEIIDRGMPAKYVEKGSLEEPPTGMPVEVIEIAPGAPLPRSDQGIGPGAWMWQDLDAQDNAIEKALGLHPASLGDKSPGVTPYAALALQVEQDSVKFDPIAQEFRLSIADLGRDTVEAMRQWGPAKQLMIAGDDDQLQAMVFDATRIPAGFKVRPAKGASLPRNQAAEIQKVSDLWTAALTAGLVAQAPQDWINWYRSSLDSGKAEEMPERDQRAEQLHKAALENVVMVRTGQPLPVAPYDDPNVHVPEHREAQMQLDEQIAMGDQQAAAQSAAVEQHVQQHLMQAQQNAAQAAPVAPGGPAPGTPMMPGPGAGAAAAPVDPADGVAALGQTAMSMSDFRRILRGM